MVFFMELTYYMGNSKKTKRKGVTKWQKKIDCVKLSVSLMDKYLVTDIVHEYSDG